MAQSQITFSDESELTLKKVEILANKNGVICKNKVAQTNYALAIIEGILKHLDDESFERVTGLKK